MFYICMLYIICIYFHPLPVGYILPACFHWLCKQHVFTDIYYPISNELSLHLTDNNQQVTWEKTQNILHRGLIFLSQSPWSSPDWLSEREVTANVCDMMFHLGQGQPESPSVHWLITLLLVKAILSGGEVTALPRRAKGMGWGGAQAFGDKKGGLRWLDMKGLSCPARFLFTYKILFPSLKIKLFP